MQKVVYNSYKSGAKTRNLPFDITRELFNELITKPCYYCGAEPNNKATVAWNDDVYVYQGIDRIDNLLGYTKENCVPCCKQCNLGKRDLSSKDFLEWITSVHLHSIKGNYDRTNTITSC